jgi:asparagine N-glycosylation enzyme membrane subunit Stt3
MPEDSHRSGLRHGLALAAAVALGVWARCSNWRNVFTAQGVELLPSDSHYYVRFALLQLRSFPRFHAFDPYVNFPTGAFICWPPIHAWSVAAALALAGRARAELGAAWVDPAWATAELVVLGLLTWRWVGRRSAIATVLLYALIPALVLEGALGNADHHVHEGFWVALTSVLAGRALETGSRRTAVWAGIALGAGRLFTPSAFVVVPCIAVAWPLSAFLSRAGRPAGATREVGAVVGWVCSATLAVSVLVFGRWTLELEQLSFFHPLFALAAFGASLAALETPRDMRWAAASVGIALVATVPIAPELLRAAAQMGRVDPVLAFVDESKPLWRDPGWAMQLMGAAVLALPLGVWGAVRGARSGVAREVPALASAGVFLVAAAMQARFAPSLSGALAVLLPAAAPHLLPSGGLRRLAVGAAALGLASYWGSLVPESAEPPPDIVAMARPTLWWMRDHLPPASADPYSTAPPEYGVASHPLLGHLILLWAQRPVLATMFSQAPVHVAGIERNAAILGDPDDEEAFQRAHAARSRYVLVTPSATLIGDPSFDPKRSLWGRLLETAGIDATDPARTTGHFRLVHDSEERRRGDSDASYARLFEAVEGARLIGQAAPGETVVARREVRTDRKQTLAYARSTVADSAGLFALRVPYACASPQTDAVHLTSSGGAWAEVCIPEAAVEKGETLDVGSLGR